MERLQTGFFTSADAAAAIQGTTTQWAEESYAVAARLISAVSANGVLDDADRASILPGQLSVGGLPLAKVLNDAFSVSLIHRGSPPSVRVVQRGKRDRRSVAGESVAPEPCAVTGYRAPTPAVIVPKTADRSSTEPGRRIIPGGGNDRPG